MADRNKPPTDVRRAITEGAAMLGTNDSGSLEPSTADTFGDDEGTDVGKPPHRRRATRADIEAMTKTLGDKVQSWIDIDKQEHAAIRSENAAALAAIRTDNAGALSEVNTRIGTMTNKIDENRKTNDQQNLNILTELGKVAIESAKTATHVGHLVPEFERERSAKAVLDTTSKQLEMNADAKDSDVRRKVWEKVAVGVVGLLLTILGAFVEHYIVHPRGATPAPAPVRATLPPADATPR